jgi:hypothetical protein
MGEQNMKIVEARRVQREMLAAKASAEKAERLAVERGVSETIALSERRGDQFSDARRGSTGARRKKDGLDWLYDKGRISARQRQAGEKYGIDWRRAQPPGLRSCIDDTVRGFGDQPGEARAHAEAMLGRARALALNGNKALAEACDLVCGAGLKPSDWAGGDDRLAGRYEERTQRALEMLERYYFG